MFTNKLIRNKLVINKLIINKLIINKLIINKLNKSQSIRSIKIGSKASLSKIFTKEDVKKFAELSLDNNEIHLDMDAARRSGFDKQIVHGILINGLVSAVLGTILPGKGSILISEKIKFLKPVHIDRKVTVEIEIINIIDKMNKTFYECEFKGYVDNSKDYDNKSFNLIEDNLINEENQLHSLANEDNQLNNLTNQDNQLNNLTNEDNQLNNDLNKVHCIKGTAQLLKRH